MVPGPYLVGIASHAVIDYRTYGFDANLEFEPQLGVLPGNPAEDGIKIHDYASARKRMIHGKSAFPSHPCVVVAWDNTPRRGEHGVVFINATPEHFDSRSIRASRRALCTIATTSFATAACRASRRPIPGRVYPGRCGATFLHGSPSGSRTGSLLTFHRTWKRSSRGQREAVPVEPKGASANNCQLLRFLACRLGRMV